MKISLISIFPESFEGFFSSSMFKKAQDNNLIEINYYKLNDFSDKKFKQVDDKAFGMHGQVISPIPLAKAIEYVKTKSKNPKIIYMAASGDLLTQEKVEKYYQDFLDNDLIIICGHYEGIDQRIIEIYVDYQISIGEYVLTSGELAASVFIDSLIRHIPGVLGNKLSLENDSFSKNFDRQKEYPVYTRPQEFQGLKVPEVLTSGNHKEIANWQKNNLF